MNEYLTLKLKKDSVGLADIEESSGIVSCKEQVEILKKRLIEANNNIQIEVSSFWLCPSSCSLPFMLFIHVHIFVAFSSSCARKTEVPYVG